MNDMTLAPPARAGTIALAPSPVRSLPLTMQLMLRSGDFNAASAVRWFGPKHPELDFRALAIERRASLAPADRRWLKDRLTRMAMADGFGTDNARHAAWLAETGRLLMSDPTIPGDILAYSIDEAIKTAARGFMPKVGEIRAIADPLRSERERETVRLEAMARVLEPPKPAPAGDGPPGPVCTPEQAAAIKAEFGLASDAENRATVRATLGPARNPTPSDIAQIAAAMGIALTLKENEQ